MNEQLPSAPVGDAVVRADTLRWLERAVIGLNLCPFARGVYVKNQVHVAISHATDEAAWLADLRQELTDLWALDPAVRDTSLLVLPDTLDDFLLFNDSLDAADAVLHELGLEGHLQIAPFHPRFQFAGTDVDDVTNCTNRAPYPTLHLIRETSIDRAVAAFPEAEMIYEVNMATMERLGAKGWAELDVGPHR